MKTMLSVSLLAAVVVAAGAEPGWAHGLAGKRFFPATLAVDDPFVSDELSLPTVLHSKRPGTGETPPRKETDVSGELAKRFTPNLGLALGGTWKAIDPVGGKSVTGFDNLELSLKYQFFKSEAHETVLSLGVGWDVGGTGAKKVDAESFDTVTPSLFFGKGFGDLPGRFELLKPLALTGAFGWAVPSRVRNQKISSTADGDVEVEREFNPTFFRWGFAVEYSLPYLQSFVRDVGLPRPFSRMIPLVELSLQTPIDGPRARYTTGTVNPGIIWAGRYFQIGIEAVVPVNADAGKNVGVRAQLHFYLDDLFPKTLGRPPFGN